MEVAVVAAPRRAATSATTDPDSNEFIEVSGLGIYSMRDIHDALAVADKRPIVVDPGLAVATGKTAQQQQQQQQQLGGPSTAMAMTTMNGTLHEDSMLSEDDDSSQCSWSHEDEDGVFYYQIHQQLTRFAHGTEMTLTMPLLSRKQRRFVHAIAQIMGMGHASLGPQGRQRQMIVFKRENETRKSPPSEPATAKKRKRVPKIVNGFPCRFTGCLKTFDRASERKKHEQSHQPEYCTQFKCLQCGRGFRYNKDLHRHQRVHTSEFRPGESFSSDTTTSLTSASRVSSATSLLVRPSDSRSISPALGKNPHPLLDFRVEPLIGNPTWNPEFDAQAWNELDELSELLNPDFRPDHGWTTTMVQMHPS